MRATFRPLRQASASRRGLLFIAGPLVWLVALVVVSWVLDHFQAIELGLLVAGASFVVWVLVLLPARWAREREERRA